MFPGMKIRWRMTWHSKHQVSDQIEENLVFWKNWMFRFAKLSSVFSRCAVRQSVLLVQVQQNRTVQYGKLKGPEFPRLRAKRVRLWRTPLVYYLGNPSRIADRKVRRQASKYIMLDNTLYRRTIDGVLLKCLGSDQSKIVMGEVHEGICGTHQSAHKMK
jgi:hypothetical protein